MDDVGFLRAVVAVHGAKDTWVPYEGRDSGASRYPGAVETTRPGAERGPGCWG